MFGIDNTRSRRAHRVSLMLAGMVVPEWDRNAPEKPPVVDHICKNLACVNPKHLRLVSQRFNSVENSISPMARNAKKTTCAKGHPYTPENTLAVKRPGRVTPNGVRIGACTARICLTCNPGKRPAVKDNAPNLTKDR
jgi:hypothetical protein